MRNWRPSSLREVWNESFPQQEIPKSCCQRLLFILSQLFWGLLYFSYRLPIVGIQIFIFIKNPNWIQGIGIILAFVFSFLLYSLANYLHSFEAIKSILRYLKFDLEGKFTLKEYSLEQYIGNEKIQEIKASRVVSWARRNQYPISRIFVRKQISESNKKTKIFGQMKGFAAPIAYYKLGLPPQPISLIFIDQDPTKLNKNISAKFFVYHEIGHTTKHAWRIKTKPCIAAGIILGTFIWSFFNTNNYLTIFISLFLYFFLRIYLEINPLKNSLDDELIADTFAIRRLPKNFPLTKEDNRKKNLLKILEKPYSPAKNDDLFKEIFKRKQWENAQDMIKKRKENIPLTIFEIGKRIPVSDVFVLDVILIFIALQLHPTSILFLLCILALSLILLVLGVFIYLTRIIPGTNLIEETIAMLKTT